MDIAYVIVEFQIKFPSTALKCMQLLGTASQLTLGSKAMQASDERRGAIPSYVTFTVPVVSRC